MGKEKEILKGEDKLMTIANLAKYLNISRRTVYRVIQEGKLPGYRVGKNLRFKKNDVDMWLESKKEIGLGEMMQKSPQKKD